MSARWTADEDRLLRRVWTLGGCAAATKALPQRSAFACTGRAKKLGLRVDSEKIEADRTRNINAGRHAYRRGLGPAPPIDGDLSVPESWG